ncbi:hypothetical protein [Streptomyces sp. NPDC018045]|uniref:hypothetical protein n=1 Tax=Streptomyces sp. NPDC018045 TaxID=3365037 RepID=UPI0037B69B3A
MRAAWTTFATHGDPGWPAYDTTRHPPQLFDIRPTVTPYPDQDSRPIWQDHVFPALTLMGR